MNRPIAASPGLRSLTDEVNDKDQLEVSHEAEASKPE
jgi:hypothetical protein